MGYEVYVEGEITFNNINGFKKDFDKITQKLTSEIGLEYEDFDYFFTKIWGNNLENLNEYDDLAFTFTREGKLWFNDDEAMKFLSKYAKGTVKFFGEDDTDWKFELDGEGNIIKKQREKW